MSWREKTRERERERGRDGARGWEENVEFSNSKSESGPAIFQVITFFSLLTSLKPTAPAPPPPPLSRTFISSPERWNIECKTSARVARERKHSRDSSEWRKPLLVHFCKPTLKLASKCIATLS